MSRKQRGKGFKISIPVKEIVKRRAPIKPSKVERNKRKDIPRKKKHKGHVES